MLNPDYIINQLTQAVQMYNVGKAQILTTNAVYSIAAQFSNKNLANYNVAPITGLSDTSGSQPFEITSDAIATGVYNNSQNTEMFSMILNSELGVNDGLIVIQYNDMSPDLNQILFVKSQEMLLSEEVKIKLKPNDCVIIAFGKIREDGKPLRVNITTVGKNYKQQDMLSDSPQASVVLGTRTGTVSSTRKSMFIGLMIVLAIATGVFIYTIANPPKASFRRRR